MKLADAMPCHSSQNDTSLRCLPCMLGRCIWSLERLETSKLRCKVMQRCARMGVAGHISFQSTPDFFSQYLIWDISAVHISPWAQCVSGLPFSSRAINYFFANPSTRTQVIFNRRAFQSLKRLNTWSRNQIPTSPGCIPALTLQWSCKRMVVMSICIFKIKPKNPRLPLKHQHCGRESVWRHLPPRRKRIYQGDAVDGCRWHHLSQKVGVAKGSPIVAEGNT